MLECAAGGEVFPFLLEAGEEAVDCHSGGVRQRALLVPKSDHRPALKGNH